MEKLVEARGKIGKVETKETRTEIRKKDTEKGYI